MFPSEQEILDILETILKCNFVPTAVKIVIYLLHKIIENLGSIPECSINLILHSSIFFKLKLCPSAETVMQVRVSCLEELFDIGN